MGYLPFTRENRKFQLEDQMVRAIPFGKLQKIWALICGDAILCGDAIVGICREMGYLPFTRENRKFQLEDQMVRAIPFGKLQKIWALICGDAIFLLF